MARRRTCAAAGPRRPALRLSRTPSTPLSAVAARPAEEDLAVALEWLERALEGNRGASGEEAPVSKTIVEVLRGIVRFTRDTEDLRPRLPSHLSTTSPHTSLSPPLGVA